MFDLTNEQKDIRQAAREFAEKEFRDIARELDDNERFDDTLWKKAAENGFLGAFIPEEYGGAGLGHFEQCLIIEEFARVDGGIAQSMVRVLFRHPDDKALRHGGAEAEVPAPRLRGRVAGGHGIHRARRGQRRGRDHHDRGKGRRRIRHSGNKMFITNANIANYIVVLCVTDPTNPKKHDRLSTIIVETDRPGYEASKLHGKLSIRCSDTGEVAFKEVRVPEENLVGKEGRASTSSWSSSTAPASTAGRPCHRHGPGRAR